MIYDFSGRNVRKLLQAAVIFSFCVDKWRDTHIYQCKHDFFEWFPVKLFILCGTHETVHPLVEGEEDTFYRERGCLKVFIGGNLHISQHITGLFYHVRTFKLVCECS